MPRNISAWHLFSSIFHHLVAATYGSLKMEILVIRGRSIMAGGGGNVLRMTTSWPSEKQHNHILFHPFQVSDLIRGNHSSKIDDYVIVDCRYPYEYQGGHIKVSPTVLWTHFHETACQPFLVLPFYYWRFLSDCIFSFFLQPPDSMWSPPPQNALSRFQDFLWGEDPWASSLPYSSFRNLSESPKRNGWATCNVETSLLLKRGPEMKLIYWIIYLFAKIQFWWRSFTKMTILCHITNTKQTILLILRFKWKTSACDKTTVKIGSHIEFFAQWNNYYVDLIMFERFKFDPRCPLWCRCVVKQQSIILIFQTTKLNI